MFSVVRTRVHVHLHLPERAHNSLGIEMVGSGSGRVGRDRKTDRWINGGSGTLKSVCYLERDCWSQVLWWCVGDEGELDLGRRRAWLFVFMKFVLRSNKI